nr:uncharacterized protein LOC115851089 [Globicephala melas]
MSSGRRSERRGERARGRAATRVRCETGNRRRGTPPPAAAPPGAARKRLSVSAFRLEVPSWDALPAAVLTPGDRVGPPAPRRAAGLASPSTEAEERARPTSGSAWDAGALATRRAGGPAAGSSASPGLESAALGASSPRSPVSGVQRGPPLLRALFPALLVALGRRPTAGTRPRAHGRRLPKSNVEAPPGKEVRLPLHAAPRGIWTQQEIARAPSLRLCSQPSLC